MRVHVLVDLDWRSDAGGHVVCWKRLSRAAVGRADLDLTVHFSGAEDGHVETLADNVRWRIHAPVFSTSRLPFMSHLPDHTDLARRHKGLARHLDGAELVHTTDAYFNFARTAAAFAARHGVPLTTSIHTDTPNYARVFTVRTVERLTGRLGRRLLVDGLRVHERAERDMRARLVDHLGRCNRVLLSGPDDWPMAAAVVPEARLSFLRRGIDKEFYHPRHGDRAWLADSQGIPAGRTVLLFVGRINAGKNVQTLVAALAELIARGHDLHLVCAGDGELRDWVAAQLGDRVSLAGVLDHATLARVYASTDLFVLPSEIETWSNATQEALASGLPVAVSARAGIGRFVRHGEMGAVVAESGIDAWTAALGDLVADPARLAAQGRAARAHAEAELPGWDDVLEADVLPVWRDAMTMASAPGIC